MFRRIIFFLPFLIGILVAGGGDHHGVNGEELPLLRALNNSESKHNLWWLSLTEKFPNWLSEEISSVKMKKSETLDLTGYVLSINNKENSIDIQFYQQLPDGRYISTLVLQNKNELKLIIQAREKTNDAQDYTIKIIVNN